MSNRRGRRKRVIVDINVLPYIDVMLVLLVIFMITAPLLNQGIELELPQVASNPLPPDDQEPLVLSVDRSGAYYLNHADEPLRPLAADAVLAQAAGVLRSNPRLPVLIRADEKLDYGVVVQAMLLLQRAGASKIGLSTENPEVDPSNR